MGPARKRKRISRRKSSSVAKSASLRIKRKGGREREAQSVPSLGSVDYGAGLSDYSSVTGPQQRSNSFAPRTLAGRVNILEERPRAIVWGNSAHPPPPSWIRTISAPQSEVVTAGLYWIVFHPRYEFYHRPSFYACLVSTSKRDVLNSAGTSLWGTHGRLH